MIKIEMIYLSLQYFLKIYPSHVAFFFWSISLDNKNLVFMQKGNTQDKLNSVFMQKGITKDKFKGPIK